MFKWQNHNHTLTIAHFNHSGAGLSRYCRKLKGNSKSRIMQTQPLFTLWSDVTEINLNFFFLWCSFMKQKYFWVYFPCRCSFLFSHLLWFSMYELSSRHPHCSSQQSSRAARELWLLSALWQSTAFCILQRTLPIPNHEFSCLSAGDSGGWRRDVLRLSIRRSLVNTISQAPLGGI